MAANIRDTLLFIQKLEPEDNEEEDAESHSHTCKMVNKAPDTQDDEKFTLQDVSDMIPSLGEKKPQERRI